MTTLLRTMGLDPCTAAPAAALPARSRFKPWLGAVLLGLFMTACGGGGGGRDPILGADVVAPVTPGGVVVVPVPTPVPPTVTAVAPVNNATGVAINNTLITAAFSEPVAAFGVDGASFVVTCAAPCVNPGGTVALDSTKKIATLSLPSGTTLGTSTVYTGTIIGAKSLATGLAMATPYVWQFTTGVTPDTTRPRVVITVPATTTPGPTPAVAANTAITAVFTEDMAPATISSASFSITCAAPCVTPAGTVTYVAGNRTAIFTPAAPLAASTNYTVTVNTTATDLAGNALAGNQAALPAASNYVWSFTTAAAVPAANV
ncbi:MAG: Ig-like domain-containing protein, partial [Burkholderiaceae bacterium]|nr:Ig-like domain-containing protein [Burkholderiaceae bacterium]